MLFNKSPGEHAGAVTHGIADGADLVSLPVPGGEVHHFPAALMRLMQPQGGERIVKQLLAGSWACPCSYASTWVHA